MNLSLLMITLITRLAVYEGQQILSEDFSWTKISSTTSKICYLRKKQLLLLALSSKSILYFKLYATELLKPFRQDTK